MSADSHISWILIRLSEHSRAEFDLLGTPGGSPTHRFPTFPHCYSGLGNRAAAARLYWPPIPAGSARRTLLLEPSFRAAKHNIPADAELPSGLCACVCAYVCVGRRKRHWLTWCPANTPVLAVWDYEGRDGSFWTPFAASRLFSAVLVWIVFMSVGF